MNQAVRLMLMKSTVLLKNYSLGIQVVAVRKRLGSLLWRLASLSIFLKILDWNMHKVKAFKIFSEWRKGLGSYNLCRFFIFSKEKIKTNFMWTSLNFSKTIFVIKGKSFCCLKSWLWIGKNNIWLNWSVQRRLIKRYRRSQLRPFIIEGGLESVDLLLKKYWRYSLS